jgi:dihydroorotate dehydrogenase electron transfer subunit
MDVTSATVLENVREAPAVHRLALAWDALGRGVRPAQFAMLALARGHLVPRPFSVSDARRDSAGREVAEFLYKPVGRVTGMMARLAPGDPVRVGGVCGRGFPEPAPDRRPVLLAGGIGNAPFALHVRALLERAADPASIHLFLAGRSAGDLWIQPWVRDSGVTIIEATDDGSRGERGRITDVLLARLPDLGPIEAFACGPAPMLAAVRRLAIAEGFPAWLAVEERMACGYGVCNACVIERAAGSEGEGRYRKVCTDGPVFEAREVLP